MTKHKGDLMLGASLVTLQLLAAPGLVTAAHAADNTFLYDGVTIVSATATGHLSDETVTVNTDVVAAGVAGTTVSTTATVGGQAVSAGVTANQVSASATGNSSAVSWDAASLGGDVSDGYAGLHLGLNGPGAAINAAVAGSSLSVAVTTLDAVNAGSFANSGNSIAAAATLNGSTNLVTGEVPETYASATAGNAALAFDEGTPGELVGAQGSVALSNTQVNLEVGPGVIVDDGEETYASRATVAGSSILLGVTPSGAGGADVQSIVSSPVLDDNRVTADYRGNQTRNSVLLEGGSAPEFEGSVAVSNLQANIEGGAGVAASVTGTQIGAVVGSDAETVPSATLNGTLSVSGNGVAATAAGNLAGTPLLFGNEIRLESGLSFAGTGSYEADLDTDVTGSRLGFDSAGVAGDAGAGLVILNSQSNVDSPHVAGVGGTAVSALVQNLVDGGIVMEGNSVAASATGNDTKNRILGPGIGGSTTTSFDGSAAIASAQVNYGAPVGAEVDGASISATAGNASVTGEDSVLFGSSVVLEGNAVTSAAVGSQATNALAVSATDVALDVGQAGIAGGYLADGRVAATAGASVANLQANYQSAVSASTEDVQVTIAATDIAYDDIDGDEAVAGAALRNIDGDILAGAQGNVASNIVAVEGTAVAGSSALGNVQMNDGGSVTAAVSDGVFAIAAGADSGLAVDVESSTVELAGNEIAATATGNAASNASSVGGTNIRLAADGNVGGDAGPASEIGFDPAAALGLMFDNNPADLPQVVAGHAVLNVQGVSGDVAASVSNTGSPFSVAIGEDLQASSVGLDGNAIRAAATANQGSSSLAIDVSGTLGVIAGIVVDGEEYDDEYAPLASVASVQTRADGADVSASLAGSASAATTTFVVGVDTDVKDASTVSLSGNVAQALARGNFANGGNALTVTGNQVLAAPSADEDALGGLALGLGGMSADMALTIQNAQAGGTGTVSASQAGTGALVSILDDLDESSVSLEGNQFLSGAFDNTAINRLTVDVNHLAASAGVQSFQTSGAGVSAVVGAPGAPGVPLIPGDLYDDLVGFSGTSSPGVITNTGPNLNVSTGMTLTFNISDLAEGDAELADLIAEYLDDAGFTVVGYVATYTNSSGSTQTLDMSAFASVNLSGNSEEGYSITYGSFSTPDIPAVPGIDASPMISVHVGSDIEDSTVAIAGTIIQASAVANTVSNAASISANVLEAAAGLGAGDAAATIDMATMTQTAVADFAVSNHQVLEATASASAEASGAVFVEADLDGGDITGSSISVTGTRQQATAQGSLATNALSIAATNSGEAEDLSPSGMIVSVQRTLAGSTVDAESQLSVAAPGQMEGSTLALTDNRNTALSIVNEGGNGLSVSGNAIHGSDAAPASVEILPSGMISSVADFGVVNLQSSGTPSGATATTTIANGDLGEGLPLPQDEGSLVGSSAALNGNVTIAEARANLARSSIALEGGAAVTATSGVLNLQAQAGAVTANAGSTVGYVLGTETGTAVAGSGVAVSLNQVGAIAVANAATNDVSVSAALVGTGMADAASALVAAGTAGADAAHTLASQQSSGLESTAGATGSFGIGAYGGTVDSGTGAASSSLTASGNLVVGEAGGNQATNTMTLEAGSTLAATGAVLNSQARNGAVSAAASGTVALQASGLDAAAVSTSLTLTDNQTASVARGNSATNALNAFAGAAYGTAGIGYGAASTVVPAAGVASATASYSVLNSQSNLSPVSASTTGSYTVALADGAVTGSSALVSGNRFSSSAVGNTAANSLKLSALAGGNPPAAITSVQVNTGAVTSLTTGTSIGIAAGGSALGVGGSTLGVSGNSVSASATGNSVTSAISVK